MQIDRSKDDRRWIKGKKIITKTSWTLWIFMPSWNKAFFLNQLPLFPEDKSSWNLESWQKVCHGFSASWREAVFLSLGSSALRTQCFKNFTFILSASLLITLNTTSPPQPSLSCSSVVNQIILSNILVHWRQCKYSNFFGSLISLCYRWRLIRKKPILICKIQADAFSL